MINEILTDLLQTIAEGYGNLTGTALRLVEILAILEVALVAMWWGFGKSDVIEDFLKQAMKIGFFIFFILSFDDFLPYVIGGFIQAGDIAARGSDSTYGVVEGSSPTFYSPDALIVKGLTTGITMILIALASIGISSIIPVIGWILYPIVLVLGIIYIVAGVLITLAFITMAINIVLALVEFYVISVLSIILLPFGVFKHTSFISEKVFPAVVSHGLKLMVMSFILGVAAPIFKDIIVLGDTGGYGGGLLSGVDGGLAFFGSFLTNLLTMLEAMFNPLKLIKLLILSWLFSTLVSKVPQLASGLMGGGPSMGTTPAAIAGGIQAAGQQIASTAMAIKTGGATAAMKGAGSAAGAAGGKSPVQIASQAGSGRSSGSGGSGLSKYSPAGKLGGVKSAMGLGLKAGLGLGGQASGLPSPQMQIGSHRRGKKEEESE